ncbi:MAG: ABC transporter ATP-binding protein [Candidatus Rokubacteria bacterium]|nr:ABC transporter ATP-binding protein [Candidatus Rokubacteria bacterium]MBI2525676.1 ABC transporter ATP-binding protein [Candidatus Rokubacteria bacterium]
MAPGPGPALALEGVNTYYGPSHILFDLGLTVGEGTVTCLLGRNGAGKTTAMRTIMGLTPPRSGAITFRGTRISGLRPWQIFRRGIKLVPQGRGIFPPLSVEENLRLALLRAEVPDPRAEIEKVFALFPVLAERRRQRGQTLSGGELQMLAIARALLGRTGLILMDEPTEGLAPLVVRAIQETLHRIKREGVTVLLAEQNARMALDVGDWHHIIDDGRIHFSGNSRSILGNEEIMTQYLGVSQR